MFKIQLKGSLSGETVPIPALAPTPQLLQEGLSTGWSLAIFPEIPFLPTLPEFLWK